MNQFDYRDNDGRSDDEVDQITVAGESNRPRIETERVEQTISVTDIEEIASESDDYHDGEYRSVEINNTNASYSAAPVARFSGTSQNIQLSENSPQTESTDGYFKKEIKKQKQADAKTILKKWNPKTHI